MGIRDRATKGWSPYLITELSGHRIRRKRPGKVPLLLTVGIWTDMEPRAHDFVEDSA